MKKRYQFLLFFFIAVSIFLFSFKEIVEFDPPKNLNLSTLSVPRQHINDSTFRVGKNHLLKNKYGIWELYAEGKPLERGIFMGKLLEELLEKQEQAFFQGMQELVPSMNYLQFLKYLVAWQNRNLDEYIPQELQREIYGLSLFAADEFDFIGSKYQRKLTYHAAHDIGHTLQNLGLVGGGCTALSVWGEAVVDSNLLLARNFDFYVGDAFAKQKIAYFIRPNKGIPYFSYAWSGMIGVVSGMNKAGLAVVLNAGPPAVPGASKTPVSILAREILQYATNIEEAFSIAKSREIFVSENFIISSAKDKKTVVIEKSPDQTLLYEKHEKIVCSNHFQHFSFEHNEENVRAKKETSTVYRYEKMTELLTDHQPLDEQEVVAILRNLKGLNNHNLGLGNEMALNQLQAHHSIIFKPEKREVWISTAPWQMGEFVHYNLEDIFENKAKKSSPAAFLDDKKTIEVDSFIYSDEFCNYLKFRELKKELEQVIEQETTWTDMKIDSFLTLNPEHYETPYLLGKYYRMKGNKEAALWCFRLAENCAIPWQKDREEIENALKKR